MNKYKAIRAAIRAGIYEPKTAVQWIWDTFGVDIGMGEFTVIMKEILTEEPSKPPAQGLGGGVGCLALIVILGFMFMACMVLPSFQKVNQDRQCQHLNHQYHKEF